MSLEAAVTLPRFGTFPPVAGVPAPVPNTARNWVDPRLSPILLRTLREGGVTPVRRHPADTGLGAVLRIGPEGTERVTVPIPYLADPFGTSSR